MGKSLHLEANERDLEELVKEHAKDLKTENLEEFKKKPLYQERDKGDSLDKTEKNNANR